MSRLISAVNEWSCALACVEAILADNGKTNTQDDIIQNIGPRFLKWKARPGLMSGAIDFESVFREVGFCVAIAQPQTNTDAIAEMQNHRTVGAIMWVSKFWENPFTKNKLCDLNHALRLVSADCNGVVVMNPYRHPLQPRDESYTWQEVGSFEGGILVFQK